VLLDPFKYKNPQGYYIPQHPIQFVDDTYLCSRSLNGAEQGLRLMMLAGPILNIFINPAKTRFLRLVINSQGKAEDNQTTTLTALAPDGTATTIQALPTYEAVRCLGAYVTMDMNDSYIMDDLRKTIKRSIAILQSKRASPFAKTKAITASLLPMVGYRTKFSTASMHTLSTQLAAPIREFVSTANNLRSIAHAITFADSSHPAGLALRDPLDYFMSLKEQMTLRALGSDSESLQIMHSMLHRTYEHLNGVTLPSVHPRACPPSHSPLHKGITYLPTWGHSLVHHLHQGEKNIYLNHPPLSSKPGLTHTPLLDEITAEDAHTFTSYQDAVTRITEFLDHANLYYV
jgi:hypothetical protein